MAEDKNVIGVSYIEKSINNFGRGEVQVAQNTHTIGHAPLALP
jgi:hypothetical protein